MLGLIFFFFFRGLIGCSRASLFSRGSLIRSFWQRQCCSHDFTGGTNIGQFIGKISTRCRSVQRRPAFSPTYTYTHKPHHTSLILWELLQRLHWRGYSGLMEQSGCWWLRPAACLPRWSKSNAPWWSSVGDILPPLVCILPSKLLPYRLIECILVFLLQFLRQDWGGQTERLHAYRSGDVETWFHNTKLFCFLFVHL